MDKELEALWGLNQNFAEEVTFSREVRKHIMEKSIKKAQSDLINIIIKNYLDIQVVGKTKESEKAIKDFQQALKRKLLELKEVKPNSSHD